MQTKSDSNKLISADNAISIYSNTVTDRRVFDIKQNIKRDIYNKTAVYETNLNPERKVINFEEKLNKMDSIDLSGKVAIVTGASSGIGAETAIAFARFGATLSLVGRDEVRLLETVNKCAAVNNVLPLFIPLDLAHEGACEAVVNKTVETYGRIDILVNSAGKMAFSFLADSSMEQLDDLMNVNFRVPYHLSQLVLPYLVKTKGNIVNIGSSMSKRSTPGVLGYTISKAALQMFSRQAAFELAPKGVRINCINPGPSKTNILAKVIVHHPELREQINNTMKESTCDGKMLDPKEVAILVCLTASDIFPSLNGSDMLFDGAACNA